MMLIDNGFLRDKLLHFEKISLDDIDNVRLLSRFDYKFIVENNLFYKVLSDLKGFYKILFIKDVYSRYETNYYDTPDFAMYRQHHNGKLNRYKIRRRTYMDTDLAYMEVKFKNNKNRTIKKRIPWDSADNDSFVENNSFYRFTDLEKKININYNRVTFIDNNLSERVTADFDLRFSNDNNTALFPGIFIIEVKQDNTDKNSRILQIMRDNKIRPLGLSKYCIGVSALYPAQKRNAFKRKIRSIEKLSGNNTTKMNEGDNAKLAAE